MNRKKIKTREQELIGVMSEQAKELWTSYCSKLYEKGQVIKDEMHYNPYDCVSQWKKDNLIQVFWKVASRKNKVLAAGIETQEMRIYKLLETQVYKDFPKYENHVLVFGQDGEIFSVGEKSKIKIIAEKITLALSS